MFPVTLNSKALEKNGRQNSIFWYMWYKYYMYLYFILGYIKQNSDHITVPEICQVATYQMFQIYYKYTTLVLTNTASTTFKYELYMKMKCLREFTDPEVSTRPSTRVEYMYHSL